MRLPAGTMHLGERPAFWLGDIETGALLAWARSRLATLDPERDDDLREDLVGLVSMLPLSEAVEVLAGLAAGDEDEDVRHRAISYLGRRPEDTIGRLERLFDSADDPDDRARALTTLADRQGPTAKNRLLRAARSAEEVEAVRRIAISYLSRVEGRDVDEAFERLLADPDPDLRRRVVAAWERREPARAVPLLERTAGGDEEREVREAAVSSLGDIDSPLALAALQRIFDSSSDERVRRRALRERVERIAATGEKVTLLAGVARDDPHFEVRKDAVRYLGNIDDPAARRVLRQLLDIGRL
jgi:HEAT repeat protein